MKSFADYLQRAIRNGDIVAEEGAVYVSASSSSAAAAAPTLASTSEDWSPHYVDYIKLKACIMSCMQRRAKLAELINDGSGNVYLTEEDMKLVLATSVGTDTGSSGSVGQGELLAMMGKNNKPNATGDYFQYAEGNDRSSFRVDPQDAMARLSNIERQSFTRLLDGELERAATFYSSQLVRLAQMIAELEGGTDQAQYEAVGREILELLAFVVTNIICLRQILIRYDAFVRSFDGRPLLQWYLKEKTEKPIPLACGMQNMASDHISELFHLEALSSLEDTYAVKLGTAAALHMSRQKTDPTETYTNEGGSTASLQPSLMKFYDRFTKDMGQFRELLDKTSDSVNRAAGGSIVMRDHIVNGMRTIRHYFVLGSGLRTLNMEPKILTMRGRHLKEEIRSIAKWREVRDLVPEEEADAASKLDPKNVLPLILNLVACFLYMMNNYIIEPSSAYYAESLGSSDAMSGLMIGASPWFALISSIFYSIWTNRSYRHPMIFACGLTFVGNLLYASAGSVNSMPLCLFGRALTGLGATRIINRRYIADATPFALRTAASAAFSLVTALGAAMGPALAVLLDYLDFEFYLPILGKQEFNGMTGPGFFMALMWLLFTFLIIAVFNEPSRSGLDELKQRETKSETDKSGSVDAASPLFDDNGSATFENDDWNDDQLLHVQKDVASRTTSRRSNAITHCLRNITKPVILTMSLIFMKRIALESIVGSTSVVTKNRYGWSIKNVGTLHFVNGMIVIPISILSGWLSQYYQDRYLALCLMSITLVGMLVLIDVTDFASLDSETYNEGNPLAVGPVRYIAGCLIAFSGIEACESFVASLMSKLTPSALAVGTFNSGLLTTLVGTSGRACGDVLITAMGSWSIRNLLNLLIVPSTGLVVTSIFLVIRNYEELAV